MRIRSLILGTLVSVCALALTSACGGSDNGNGSGGSSSGGAGGNGGTGGSGTAGTGGTSGSGDCTAVAKAVCNKLQQCSSTLIKLTYGDVQTCVARATITCKSGTTAPGASVTPAQLGACTTAFSNLDCADLARGIQAPSECSIAGSLVNGKACGSNDQCKSAYCGVSNGICGACADRAAAGKACTSNDGCQSGLVCNSKSVCAQPVDGGGACTDARDCKAGLVCASGTCAQPVGAGKACKKGECDSLAGLFCNPSTNVCESLQVADSGQPCGLVSGGFVACGAGGHCAIPSGQVQGTCQAAAADGDTCDAQKGPTCLQPALCVNGKCTLGDPASCK